MKNLHQYLAEGEHRYHNPATGDDFGIELADGTLIDTWIMEATHDSILLAATPEIMAVLEDWHELDLYENDDDAHSALLEQSVDEGKWFRTTYGWAGGSRPGGSQYAHPERQQERAKERAKARQVNDLYHEFKERHDISHDIDDDDFLSQVDQFLRSKGIEDPDRIQTVGELFLDMRDREDMMDEAKYQGREVPLNKPMRGDQAKFKVYVRDPKTGNIKKVNFGHGGKSAKRLGQKTMRIRKSNPKARKSFRARHHCENPGPKTMARYWSCRMW